MQKKQGFILYGASLLVLPVLAVVCMLLMKVSGFQPGPDFKYFFFAVLMSIAVLILNSLAILTGDFLLDALTGFHEKYNTENLHRKPISFAIRNRDNIRMFYRILFFLGSCLELYGVWFDKAAR
ncbi:hypothetical protein SAMN04488122_2841 [Chitinophaga arvensicola]|uniref:Uncharacterized protein n=2 Tax=Chitinophaga arvensicola TaxID=29529 RepID=A0A1I0RHD9_9BACT|nr:hypothetical protein SAMN04488122_2841 [Chitinophaga arvensicola]